jgi:hypothetical protein
MKRLPVALALTVLVFSAAASATTIVDLAGFPSPVRLQAEGGAAQDQAAGALALADLNGNGAADLIVAARYADPRGRINAGQVFVVYGGASVQGSVFLTDAYAGPTLRGAAAQDQFGEALAAGDFDGDGRDDLAVGASWADGAGRADSGVVYLFLGAGAEFPSVDLATQAASVTVWGAQASQRCGSAVALGDLNGDGRSELIVGCPRAGAAGRVYVVAGNASPGPTIDLAASGASTMIEGTLAGGELGAALATGAANQDTKDDLLIGAPNGSPANRSSAGITYLVLGRAPFVAIPSVDQAATLTVLGAAANDNLGSAVALGDLDGDSRGDLVLGAPGASPAGKTGAGAVYAVLLPQSLPASVDLATASAAITLAGTESYDKLGTAVSVADLDGDGRLDLLAGAPNGDPPGRPQAGVLWAVSGARAAVGRGASVVTAPDLIVYGAGSSDRAASSLAVGDFSADGRLDLAMGAPRSDTALGMDAGSAYLVPGPFRLLPPPTPTPTTTPRRHYLPVLIRQGAARLAPVVSGGTHDAP